MANNELTAADLWNMFMETREQMKENARFQMEVSQQMRETDRKFAETDRKIAEEREQMREQMMETREQMRETDRKLEKLGINIGGISNSNGEFAEEYFFNSLERKKEFAGIHFDDISKDIKDFIRMPNGKKLEDQFDIVMYNEKSIALIEVKYRAREKYIEELVNRKLNNFRLLFPRFEKLNIYLGLGSLSFDRETVDKARECGVGLLRQVGEAIEYSGDWKIRAY